MTEPYQTPAPVESKEVGAPRTNWMRRGLILGAVAVVFLVSIAWAMPSGVISQFLGFDNIRGGPPPRMIDFDENRGPVPERVIEQPVSQQPTAQDASAVPVP